MAPSSSPVQRVPKAPVEPRFPGGIVVPRIDRFLSNVGVPAAETGNFLCQAVVRLRHQVVLATRPQFAAMGDGSRDTTAGRLNRVLTYGLCIEWREFAMPVEGLGIRIGVQLHLK
jgi:hypothetical protein